MSTRAAIRSNSVSFSEMSDATEERDVVLEVREEALDAYGLRDSASSTISTYLAGLAK
jgi:hypothetical protein